MVGRLLSLLGCSFFRGELLNFEDATYVVCTEDEDFDLIPRHETNHLVLVNVDGIEQIPNEVFLGHMSKALMEPFRKYRNFIRNQLLTESTGIILETTMILIKMD